MNTIGDGDLSCELDRWRDSSEIWLLDVTGGLDGISWSSARVGAGLMNGFEIVEVPDSGDCTDIGTVGGGLCLAVGFRARCSVSSIRLAFAAKVVERGNLTRGCLGGGGSPTRKSSLSSPGETDREDSFKVAISETEPTDIIRALVLSSCSSSSSRLGEIARARLMVGLMSIGQELGQVVTSDGQDDKND